MGTWKDLITDALVENGSYAVDDVPDAAHVELGRRTLNRILDAWAARQQYAYNIVSCIFALTPGRQPHLIGPGLPAPDFDAPKPARIENASIILGGNMEVPLRIRDADWWHNVPLKAMASDIPTDLYYSTPHPNGELYLWPVPSAANGIRLAMWQSVGQVAQDDLVTDFSNPYGYEDAIMLTLAERLCRPMSRPLTADLVEHARRARAAIFKLNLKSPRTSSAGYRSGSGAGNRRAYLTGWSR